MALNARPLILAEGKSVRMGSPKHLLELPNGTPLYPHQINLLRRVCPEAPTIYISLTKSSQLDDFLREAVTNTSPEPPVLILDDLQNNNTHESGGPAQGLLSATWLVVAVDCPLLSCGLLRVLRRVYQPPVTCFRNAEGFCEPLVAIWSPEALGKVVECASKGMLPGPSSIIWEIGGQQIELSGADAIQLRNVNTRGDWEAVWSLMDISGD
ncbi:nucleotide-diphospho-sugar transferase [Triangularia setosa]|uniref:Nucleotide-diphospho-sugar transferase n=1 Tax=Triangularia setosa TaxID=2587417 RepID=A0AAN7A438_9PEZI|nr:nucleotide-diphospho-sugar transferase [Podospora setosa]